MAVHYVKFEVFLPTQFTDSKGNKVTVEAKYIQDFCQEIKDQFGGYTESNPISTPPYKGLWHSKGITHIDFTTFIFTLIKLDEEEKAIAFFYEWKKKLEEKLNQEFVLISYHPIQILGEL